MKEGRWEHPIEQSLRDMIKKIVEVREPMRRDPISSAPEFFLTALRDGAVDTLVAQGQHAVSDGNGPIRTDNLSSCSVMLIKTHVGEHDRYILVHANGGDIALNIEGHQRDDIAKSLGDHSESIVVSGSASAGVMASIRAMGYKGAETKKRIMAATGRQPFHVVYRPHSNEVLIRVGEDDNVQVFEGFDSPPIAALEGRRK